MPADGCGLPPPLSYTTSLGIYILVAQHAQRRQLRQRASGQQAYDGVRRGHDRRQRRLRSTREGTRGTHQSVVEFVNVICSQHLHVQHHISDVRGRMARRRRGRRPCDADELFGRARAHSRVEAARSHIVGLHAWLVLPP